MISKPFFTLFIIFTVCQVVYGQSAIEKKPDTLPLSLEEGIYFALSPATAHPKARTLLTESFYWDETDESAPFGNDDGADAFSGFRQWRSEGKTEDPVQYLEELVKRWGYPKFDWHETDPLVIEEYLSAHPMGDMCLLGQDNAIIAIGFGQYVLEGKIEAELYQLTQKALKRQLLPLLLRSFEEDYRKDRAEKLNKMLLALSRMQR